MWAKEETDTERYRANSLLSLDSGFMDFVEDVQQAKLRGCAVLGSFMLCVALFTGGLAFPLVEVVIFPGSPDMETRVVKSVMNMIGLAFENGQEIVGMIMLICTVGIPIVLFLGMLVVMYENFFAIGFGWSAMFRPGARALLVSFMYISTSYQVVMIFLVMLFACFFTGFGSQANLRAGFHFLALYCLASIGLVQAMEFLRVEDHSVDETDATESLELARMDSITGYNLRRKFSSFFPSLPGIKETTTVDAFQVFFFQLLLLILLVMGFDQPLLDIRVMYKGVALQRMVLSLRDMITSLSTAAPFPVMLLFSLLVLVIPVLYGFLLVAAGIVDTAVRYCCGESSDQEAIYEWILWVAKVLRPWVMIDVFSIALIIVLYAVQNEYVSATIPDGIIHFERSGLPSLSFGNAAKEAAGNLQGQASEEHWLHFFSGMYLIVGAGIAAVFLRWFWSSAAGAHQRKGELTPEHSELRPLEVYQHIPAVSQNVSRADSHRSSDTPSSQHRGSEEFELKYDENVVTRYVAGKSCRCLVVWTVVCLLLHGLPPPQRHFQLSGMNKALENSMPVLNKLLHQYAPQTVGSCKYPTVGIPQPCYEYGILDKVIHGEYRITAEWMSGMRTLSLSNVSITRTQTLAARQPMGWFPDSVQASPTILHRFVVAVSGVIAQPQMFLKIEQCPKNHTTLKAIIGKGLCEPFLDTADACCESNRRFTIKIAAECHLGDTRLANVQVQDMWMDTMTVRPEMWRGHVQLLIADKNITKMVLESVKENIMYYLTEEPLLKLSGEEINVMQFLNRVLRFNSPHQDFHCR